MLSQSGNNSATKESTIIFEITGNCKQRLFCGVLEFTANPGQVCLPQWMMDNLGVGEGQSIQLRRVNLPKGTAAKVQVQLINPSLAISSSLNGQNNPSIATFSSISQQLGQPQGDA